VQTYFGRAVTAVQGQQPTSALNLETHPDKTFIGRIERGFDFLGYHFSRERLTVAKQTVANFIEKASRLYELERSTVSAVSPLEMFVKRWHRWARGGVDLCFRRCNASRRLSVVGISV